MSDFWNSLGKGARAGLVAGAALIVGATIAVAAWLLRTDYQVLFADLKPQDTALMVAELDRMKVPYRIGADGNTILVDGAVVHSTRLKLMGKDIPLHGAAGFELFNNADFGMTEFAQKINYQRALQGEITRTILSLAEVREARVHLVLPQEGLFRKSAGTAKAAITLGLKPGQALRPSQVNGIQRLVSAAVPGISPQDVTIVDQQGVALTRPAAQEAEQDAGASAAGSAGLELKRDTERMLSRKATEILEGALGPGQATATVDVTLNMDQVRVTTEDVLAAPGRSGAGATGVVVKERESIKDAGPPLGKADAAVRTANSQREVDYQVGRRVEQVASQPGAIRRLHVVAVLRQALDAQQLEHVKAMVGAAVGAVAERGDVVVVQNMVSVPEPARFLPPADVAAPLSKPHSNSSPAASWETPPVDPVHAIAALLAVAVLVAVWWIVRSRRANGSQARRLTGSEREQMLGQMRQWLDQAARS